ncbi:hypothetical protein B0H17DRAFT_1030767 [Mycena rosella]|uniref:Uncharacterized protein n=1 Tax=Mycena rosella TaxID=1033263 RepID=A0AAD7MB06_MYCRO|nr:hypothetical protein B0H17DRAFT_1030767 [Mycena rosella]
MDNHWSPQSLIAEFDTQQRPALEPSTSSFEKQARQAHNSPGPSRRIGCFAVLPGLLTVVVSWVLATAILVWLYSRRITDHPSTEDPFFNGALVAVEKVAAPKHDADGSVLAQSSLYGLTISSLASTIVPITIPLLMGLFAFLVAADWLHAQESGRTNALPTAPQYGMMVHMFSSAGFKAVYDYASFFWSPSTAVAQPIAAIRKCLAALLVLLTFNYLLVGGDLWLHSRTTSFIHHRASPLSGDSFASYALGSAINKTICPGPLSAEDGSTPGSVYNCQTLRTNNNGEAVDSNTWGNTEPDLIGKGVTTLRGQLASNQVYLVGDLAFVSRPNMTTDLDGAVFDTLALKTQCKASNCTEEFNGPGQGTYTCAEFSPAYEYLFQGANSASVNDLQRFSVADRTRLNGSYPLGASINPSGAIAVINYPTAASTTETRLGNNSLPGWQSSGSGDGGHSDTFIAECTVTAYTVKVKLSNLPSQSFTLVSDPVLADFNTTSALTPALESDGALSLVLINFLADEFQYADVSDEDAFLAAFSQNLSVAALSLASPLVLTHPITNGSFIDLQSASRYEWAPLFFYTGILYLYGFAALILSIVVSLISSPTIMHGNWPVKTTELLKLRLTDPMVLIADQFADGKDMTVDAKWSVQRGALGMYRAAGDESPPTRLGAGVVDSEHALRRRQTFGVQTLGTDA